MKSLRDNSFFSIKVSLYSDRTRPGYLTVNHPSGIKVFGPVPCLGVTEQEFASGYGNPQRIRTRPFGDIPMGLYEAWLSAAPPLVSPPDLMTDYGPHGWLYLAPVEGEALEAHRNGAFGFIITGGALTLARELRPALCGLRVRDEHMRAMRTYFVKNSGCRIRCAIGPAHNRIKKSRANMVAGRDSTAVDTFALGRR